MTKRVYHMANIRALLVNAFDEQELRQMCFDLPRFRPLRHNIARTMGQADIVDVLLDYADRQMLMEDLLALAQERVPRRFEHHKPYHVEVHAPGAPGRAATGAARAAHAPPGARTKRSMAAAWAAAGCAGILIVAIVLLVVLNPFGGTPT
ncbi:MAG TPA: hypothetical protein ENO23_06985, partial [Alphaproteobacteria bacterium]|nr:hypothetical protein [Alphaproteobacteria bacterium]